MKLELDEIQFIKQAIKNSDPFLTIKDAQQRVYATKQRISDLEKQLKIDNTQLQMLENRDNMIKILQEKLGA